MAEPLGVGERAPDVTAPLVYPDGRVEDVSLAALTAERPVLLAFYTNDFSLDCIEEWCSFRDYEWFSNDDRVRVVGVSGSRVGTHKRFIDYLDLGFPLYADRELAMTEAFGVGYRLFGLLRRPKRSVFLLDTDTEIRYRWVGEHAIDATRAQPPLGEIRDAVEDVAGAEDAETFGFER